MVYKMQKMALQKACDLVGGQSKLAEILNVTPPAITAWLSDDQKLKRDIPPKRCVQIEQATNGKITRKDLRPDDWYLFWPELAESA